MRQDLGANNSHSALLLVRQGLSQVLSPSFFPSTVFHEFPHLTHYNERRYSVT